MSSPAAGPTTIAPGGIGAIGTLAIGGNLSLKSSSTLDFDLAGGTADSLTIGGSLSVTGTANLEFSGPAPTPTVCPGHVQRQ